MKCSGNTPRLRAVYPRCAGVASRVVSSTMTSMHFCPGCGHKLEADDHFCASCGDRLEDAPAAEATEQLPAASAPQAPSAVSPPTAAPLPAPPKRPGASPAVIVAAIIGALVLLVLAVVIVVLVARSSGGSGSGSGSSESPRDRARSELRDAVEKVADAQSSVDRSLAALQASAAGVDSLQGEVADLAASVDDARSAASDAEPLVPESQREAVKDIEDALDAQASYAEQLAKLTRPAAITAAAADSIERSLDDADAAWRDASRSAARAKLDLPDVAIDADAAHQISKLAISMAEQAARRKAAQDARRQADAAMRSYLQRIENLMQQSGQGRDEIVEAVAATDNGCTMDPSVAAEQVNRVARNRQSLLDQLNVMSVPASPVARTIHDELQMGLQASIQADFHYASWMQTVANYYYMPPQGCPSGQPPHDTNYNRATSDSASATKHKQRLVAAYNRVARKYGLRANWSASAV